MEQFSFDSQSDFRDWKDAIERVLGIGGVEELLSEDEELDGAIDGMWIEGGRKGREERGGGSEGTILRSQGMCCGRGNVVR